MDELQIGLLADDLDQPEWRPRRRWSTLAFVLRSKTSAISLFIIIAFVVVAILAPLLAPQDPWKLGFKRNLPPAWVQQGTRPGQAEYLLGTDTLGRDVASRLIYGARTALFVALLAAPLAALFGTLIGLVAGYAGGWAESLLMRGTDIFNAFPAIMFTIAVVLFLRDSPLNKPLNGVLVLVIAFVLIGWVSLARIVRGAVLTQKQELYVEAARQLGLSQRRILFRHILPNCLALIIVWLMAAISRVIILEAFLGYVGVEVSGAMRGLQYVEMSGLEFAATSWGGLFFEGRALIHSNPIVLLAPSVCVILVAVSFTLLGDRLRDALDPRLRSMA
jgi:ABC-type dipeptide/oligopeptide/nickel transport system permease subunit